MPSCVVPTCKNAGGRLRKRDGITFHLFPTDEIRKSSWQKIVQKARLDEYWKPTKYSVLCSIHFEEHYLYNTKSGLKRIRKEAIPTKHLAFASDLSKSSVKTSNPSTSKNVIHSPVISRSSVDELTSDFRIQKPDCQICQLEITGYHYVCVQCENFVMCGSCDANGEHGVHYVLRMPMGRSEEEMQSVLSQVREAVTIDNENAPSETPVAQMDSPVRMEVHVKSELDDEDQISADDEYDSEDIDRLEVKIEPEESSDSFHEVPGAVTSRCDEHTRAPVAARLEGVIADIKMSTSTNRRPMEIISIQPNRKLFKMIDTTWVSTRPKSGGSGDVVFQ